MSMNFGSIRKLYSAQATWEFAAMAMIAITGILATFAVASATSLNFTEMPF